MFLLDSLLVGSLRFILDKIAAAAEAEATDEGAIRSVLLEAQMRLELGEISETDFAAVERDVVRRLRELRKEQPAGLALSRDDVKVIGVEATVADELH